MRDYKPFFYSKFTETHLFCEVGRIIASELEPSELVQKIIVCISKAVQFEEASVYVVKKELTGAAPRGVQNREHGQLFPVRRGGVLDRARLNRQR